MDLLSSLNCSCPSKGSGRHVCALNLGHKPSKSGTPALKYKSLLLKLEDSQGSDRHSSLYMSYRTETHFPWWGTLIPNFRDPVLLQSHRPLGNLSSVDGASNFKNHKPWFLGQKMQGLQKYPMPTPEFAPRSYTFLRET